MNKLSGLTLAVALAVLGCQQSHEAQADVLAVGLGETFALAAGQDAVLAGADLHVRFADVLEDSRCPTEVECFWTGQARITVDVGPATGPPMTLTFNTNPAPGLNVRTGRVGGYTVALMTLDPYPRGPDPISFDQYRATLKVEVG